MSFVKKITFAPMTAYEYIKYFLTSKGRHSFHSPFVYDFTDKCLTLKLDKKFAKLQKEQQKALKNDHSTFEMTDFGAGSRTLGTTRSVRKVYKSAATKGVFLDVLTQITAFYKPKNVLELGTSLGVGTFALTYGSEHVVTVDACPETQSFAKKHFPKTPAKVEFVNTVFEDFITHDTKVYDLIFIDGHHDGTALMRYLKLLEKNSHDETIFILDDIRWSKGMLTAWNKIISDKKYHLSMDLFKFGIVLKRQHQNKQHFVVRLRNVLKSLI